jgi:GntR family transcriptional repressor for pyruvate dehydrogenase complex
MILKESGFTRPGGGAGSPVRVAEMIASDLRQRILRRAFDEGPLPTQEALIAEYGVSGPSVREALRILEAEGLITVRRGKLGGAYVHRPNWSSAAVALAMSLQGQGVTLTDLADTLLTLEPMCAVACASRDDRMQTVVPALRENLEQTQAVLGNGQFFTETARSFHDILVDHVPNGTMRLLVRSTVAVWSVQEQMWASTLEEQGHYPEESEQAAALKAHERLVGFIENGDVEAAAGLAGAHLKAIQRMMLADYGGRVVDASSTLAVRRLRSL